jgi:predicted GNAT superfamily acetyltransferase
MGPRGSIDATARTGLRSWQPDDVDAVVRINAGAQPHVAPLDRAELERLAAAGARIHVGERPIGRAVAYLVAFPASAPYEGEEFRWFRHRLGAGFWYVDQIAIDAAERRSGLGRELYARIADEAWAAGARELCCEINLRPANPDSLTFHRRLGFDPVGELEVEDGRRVVLLIRSLTGELTKTAGGGDV